VPALIRQRDRLIGIGEPVLLKYERITFEKSLRACEVRRCAGRVRTRQSGRSGRIRLHSPSATLRWGKKRAGSVARIRQAMGQNSHLSD
jgi:hypothetical protein